MTNDELVANIMRGYEPRGRGFESCRARQFV